MSSEFPETPNIPGIGGTLSNRAAGGGLPWEIWALIPVGLIMLVELLLAQGSYPHMSYRDQWRWWVAPSFIREFPASNRMPKDEYIAKARKFGESALNWIGPGTSSGETRRKLIDAGFIQNRLWPVPEGMENSYLWSWNIDTLCFGAGYLVSLEYQNGRLISARGGYHGPAGCA